MSRGRSYSDEFKKGAIKLALSSSSVISAAQDLGIPKATLSTWIKIAKERGQVAVGATDGTISHINVAEVVDENKELKKRVARLEQEKAILKKAATYFATELL